MDEHLEAIINKYCEIWEQSDDKDVIERAKEARALCDESHKNEMLTNDDLLSFFSLLYFIILQQEMEIADYEAYIRELNKAVKELENMDDNINNSSNMPDME